ncbi:hypothetical protein [Massilia niabensis]|uniref:Uncharacterized protein n=1 Tax=Massilia niabensis TaxID=544910 RepID=A0ABW0L9H9_9BURK
MMRLLDDFVVKRIKYWRQRDVAAWNFMLNLTEMRQFDGLCIKHATVAPAYGEARCRPVSGWKV